MWPLPSLTPNTNKYKHYNTKQVGDVIGLYSILLAPPPADFNVLGYNTVGTYWLYANAKLSIGGSTVTWQDNRQVTIAGTPPCFVSGAPTGTCTSSVSEQFYPIVTAANGKFHYPKIADVATRVTVVSSNLSYFACLISIYI